MKWVILTAWILGAALQDQDPPPPPPSRDQQVVFQCDFASADDLSAWELIGGSWRWADHAATDLVQGAMVLEKDPQRYQPKFRSPTQLALLRDHSVTDFEWEVVVNSTHPPYGHRDVCIFFGYVDADHYYYAHLADAMDERANQIFIVNGADRERISTETNSGNSWDGGPHRVRVRRQTESGLIEVYFNDMTQPVMRASDKTFLEGRVGVGSFDDSAAFYSVELRTPKSSRMAESAVQHPRAEGCLARVTSVGD